MEPWQVMASFMGKATSPTGGRDGTLHYGRLDLGIYNLPSHIPANFPVATGWRSRPSTAARIGCAWRSAATARPPARTSTRR
jgi:TPP-dependent pyruvate/acetoin dehydrogenase alpha subunit